MSADVTGRNRGEGVGGAPERPPGRGKLSKQSLLTHSEQIVKCGGGHWITPLCIV